MPTRNRKAGESKERFAARLDQDVYVSLHEMAEFFNVSMNDIVNRAIQEKYRRFEAREDELDALQAEADMLETRLKEIRQEIDK